MKHLKKLFKGTCYAIVVVILGIVISYFYLKSTWKDVLTEQEFNTLITDIKQAEDLPNTFYKLYEEEYPNALNTSLNEQIVKGYFSDGFTKSPSILASIVSKYSRKDTDTTKISNKKAYVLAWKLEEETTQKQCLNWALKNFQFTKEFKGIKDIEDYYFAKDVTQFTNNDFKLLITLIKKPSLVRLTPREHYIKKSTR